MKVLVTGAAGFIGGHLIEKARRELGYVPEFDIKHGMAEGISWYLNAKPGKLYP